MAAARAAEQIETAKKQAEAAQVRAAESGGTHKKATANHRQAAYKLVATRTHKHKKHAANNMRRVEIK